MIENKKAKIPRKPALCLVLRGVFYFQCPIFTRLLAGYHITLGEDLQLDDTAKENAAALLGFLIEAVDRISDDEDSMDMQKWHKAGVRALTRAAYKKIKG